MPFISRQINLHDTGVSPAMADSPAMEPTPAPQSGSPVASGPAPGPAPTPSQMLPPPGVFSIRNLKNLGELSAFSRLNDTVIISGRTTCGVHQFD
jgi:hypothetical protein